MSDIKTVHVRHNRKPQTYEDTTFDVHHGIAGYAVTDSGVLVLDRATADGTFPAIMYAPGSWASLEVQDD